MHYISVSEFTNLTDFVCNDFYSNPQILQVSEEIFSGLHTNILLYNDVWIVDSLTNRFSL